MAGWTTMYKELKDGWMGAENGCWTSNKKAGYELRMTPLTQKVAYRWL
jgi:hypothetical protein